MGLFDEVVPVDLRISYFSAQLLFLGANIGKISIPKEEKEVLL